MLFHQKVNGDEDDEESKKLSETKRMDLERDIGTHPCQQERADSHRNSPLEVDEAQAPFG